MSRVLIQEKERTGRPISTRIPTEMEEEEENES